MKVSDEVVFLEEAFDVLNQRFFESALSCLPPPYLASICHIIWAFSLAAMKRCSNDASM